MFQTNGNMRARFILVLSINALQNCRFLCSRRGEMLLLLESEHVISAKNHLPLSFFTRGDTNGSRGSVG
jgi:hypothetical protein